MSSSLSEHLPLLASAPDGIKKLRGLILELAVRGKLVPQDPDDEPASELLKRIAQERAQLEAKGVCKKSKATPLVGEDEQLFALPRGWECSRLGHLSMLVTDGTHHTPAYLPSGVPFISVKDINGSTVSFADCRYISEDEHKQINQRCNPERGDILLCRIGTLGRPTVVDTARPFSLFVSVGLIKLPKSVELSRYLHLVLSSPCLASQYDEIKAGGSHTNKLNLGDIPTLRVPLPPLAEQHRIVAKVDELMALCDQLEAEQSDSDTAHARLVETLLDTLAQSADAADLAANWQRLAEHFDTLFTTEASIDALKQTILQLAVMGKLVSQDPTDEPASELLKRITGVRARLEAEGVCKKFKAMPFVGIDERPFEMPEGWIWERIGNYVIQTDYGLSEKTFAATDGVPVLKMGDIQGGNVILGGQKAVPPTTEGLPYLFLEPDDLLYNRTNSAELVGKTGIFRGPAQQYSFASYLIRIRCANGMVSPTFLNFAMNAPMFRETEIVPHLKQQCGQANVNGTILRNMRIPVPPAAEQRRIVAKVDELMALCDRLKADLVDSRSRQARLADTLIAAALEAT